MVALDATNGEKHLDFFLSYKSEDAVIVRMVAEQMRASGGGVWFAEYDVRLENRDQFMQAIESAIAECRFGVCFTNDRFTTSQYCCKELALLLEHLGPQRIIEIALPREARPHRLFPALLEAMSLEVPVPRSVEEADMEALPEKSDVLPCSAVDRILQHIQKSTGVALSGCDCAATRHPDRRYNLYRGVSYSLDLAGWVVKRPGWLAKLAARGGGDCLGPMFERACEGGRLSGHLIVGEQDVQRKKMGMGTADDREYYDEALGFAKAFFGGARKRHCAGVHLVFLEGLSHPAFTTLDSSGMGVVMGNSVWSRLYSVVTEGPKPSSKDREFAFFFFFRGDLASFLRSAHIMDRLVLSLECGARPRHPEVDQQTRSIIEHLTEHCPEYVRQVRWMSNPVVRLVDFLLLGLIGKVLLSLGRKASRPIGLLTQAIAVSSSRKVMAKALFYRGCELYQDGLDADAAIADYTLAVWCDPGDAWARKNRATTYEMNRHSYGKGYSSHVLPMTYTGACADLEAAKAFFTSLAADSPSPESRQAALRMLQQSEATLAKLRQYPPEAK